MSPITGSVCTPAVGPANSSRRPTPAWEKFLTVAGACPTVGSLPDLVHRQPLADGPLTLAIYSIQKLHHASWVAPPRTRMGTDKKAKPRRAYTVRYTYISQRLISRRETILDRYPKTAGLTPTYVAGVFGLVGDKYPDVDTGGVRWHAGRDARR